ncbi:MAG TPA: type II CAAX endopeptidase family protein [Candidatus Thermoplasmatota archaeon]|nr:type II CAAX endopeptidase family protein [Candidatus Thermoplasmatota archaeon]
MGRYPAGPRVVAGIGAVLVAGYFGMLLPTGLQEQGYPLAATVALATAIPLVAFLGLLAFAPDAPQAVLRRVSRADLRDSGHALAVIVMACAIFFVLGYGSLTNGIYAYEHEVVRDEPSDPISGDAIFVGIALNLIVLVLPAMLYVGVVGAGPGGALERLGLHSRNAMRALLVGFASALAVLVVIAVISAAIEGLEVDVPENERALEIARSVTVLGAIGIAVGASVSEEVFFRGFLQPRIGLLGQAVLFSLAHLTYLNVLQVVVTFVLALLFGIIYRSTGNLLAPMAAHFLFNLLMLLAGIYAPETS